MAMLASPDLLYYTVGLHGPTAGHSRAVAGPPMSSGRHAFIFDLQQLAKGKKRDREGTGKGQERDKKWTVKALVCLLST